MEHSLVSTPLDYRAAHWFIFMLTAAVSQSERQCHLVDTGSIIAVILNHICISHHIPVVYLCLFIGQTSPVKSLKPVSKKTYLFLFPHYCFPMGTYPAI